MTHHNTNTFNKENIIFISFEGIEGSGKSTQIKNLCEYLKNKTDYTIHQFREPGGTTFGEGLRKAMLESKEEIAPLSQAHLFAASRCQLLTERILPLLETKKNIVVYDRYIHSSLAYQGSAAELGIDTILSIHSSYPLNITPHLTMYLEIDHATSIERQMQRNQERDFFESKSKSFYEKVIEGFNSCKTKFANFKTIQANKSQEEVFDQVLKHTMELINEKNTQGA